MPPPHDALLACLCRVVAAHLGLAAAEVGADSRLGEDLALDSLDVLAVIDAAAQARGTRLTLEYTDPAVVERVGNLATMTVADLARCLVER